MSPISNPATLAAGSVTEEQLSESVQNKLLTLEKPTALASRTVNTEFEVSATKPALVTGFVETATLTRTKVKILVGATVVTEAAVSVSSAGVSVVPFTFAVPAGNKWKWEKVEGTIELFRTSYTVL